MYYSAPTLRSAHLLTLEIEIRGSVSWPLDSACVGLWACMTTCTERPFCF